MKRKWILRFIYSVWWGLLGNVVPRSKRLSEFVLAVLSHCQETERTRSDNKKWVARPVCSSKLGRAERISASPFANRPNRDSCSHACTQAAAENLRCQLLVSITATHGAFTGQSGTFWGSKVFPRALKPLQRIHPTEVTLHRDYTALNVRERNKGGSISLIWLQTARVDQKTPKVLLFYQRSKNWNRIRLFLVFWLFAGRFQRFCTMLHQCCTSVLFTSLYGQFFFFLMIIWCGSVRFSL